MIEGLAFIGARATWNLQHSAMPDAPELLEPPRRVRRPVVRLQVAAVMRRAAEVLDPAHGRAAVS
ncbi:hypothetical protein [uncultured Cellulomonas sp.]|uniref:hypothetical protein n=1 Tax=uncultured Cellulomonas sp. TaxID=189682 RepID=UPI0028E33702|nr:hypothetical protein [uncultured Cellulomonas sp.]